MIKWQTVLIIDLVVTQIIATGDASYNSGVAHPLADGMRRDPARLDLVAPFFNWFPEKVSVPLIPYEWLAESPKTCLSQPFQVVLTESRAKEYFPGPCQSILLECCNRSITIIREVESGGQLRRNGEQDEKGKGCLKSSPSCIDEIVRESEIVIPPETILWCATFPVLPCRKRGG